jgi:hypothetical protein
VVVILLLKELSDDSIYLPASIMRRYGLKTAGTMETPGLEENIRYFFEGKKNIALCTTDGQADPIQILDELGEKCPELTADKNWTPQPAVELCPESCRELREADGILLAVKAGRHAGKKLEYTYEYLSQQDCPVTAVLLWEADEWLIRRYYAMEKFAGQ